MRPEDKPDLAGMRDALACLACRTILDNWQSHGVRGGSAAALRGLKANPSNLIRVMPAEGVRDARASERMA